MAPDDTPRRITAYDLIYPEDKGIWYWDGTGWTQLSTDPRSAVCMYLSFPKLLVVDPDREDWVRVVRI